jgi:hypothetical protein
MVPVSQRIRANVVELRANDRRIYVRPSGWDRLYLLWTFRNFHHLPKQVLNHRQQQLIQQLCRSAVLSLDEPIARIRIMGVVENMGAVPGCESAAMGLPAITNPPGSSTDDRREIERLHIRSTSLDGSLPQQSSVRQCEPSEISAKLGDPVAQRTHLRHTVRWTLACAYAALLLPVLIYVGGRRAPHASVSPAALQTRSSASDSSPAVAHPEKGRHLLSVGKVSQAAALRAPKPWFEMPQRWNACLGRARDPRSRCRPA